MNIGRFQNVQIIETGFDPTPYIIFDIDVQNIPAERRNAAFESMKKEYAASRPGIDVGDPIPETASAYISSSLNFGIPEEIVPSVCMLVSFADNWEESILLNDILSPEESDTFARISLNTLRDKITSVIEFVASSITRNGTENA